MTLCVAGVDAANNNNVNVGKPSVGGTQWAADVGNTADQANFAHPGSTTRQFNGEL